MGLQAGYAFFASDESNQHRLNEELENANDILAMENELLEHEQELIERMRPISCSRNSRTVHRPKQSIRRSIKQIMHGRIRTS